MKAFFRKLAVAVLWSGVHRKVAAENPEIIAIAGSIGKTSTKDVTALFLAASGRPVIKTEGNLGTDTGIPISLFGFEEPPTGFWQWLEVFWKAIFPLIAAYKQRPYYVLEFSSDKPGDIDFLTKQLPISIGVLTTVAPVHLQSFASLDDLVKEEIALSKSVPKNGLLVVNADDSHQKHIATHAKLVKYSLDTASLKMKKTGFQFEEAGEIFQTQLIGRHQLYPVLAALCVAQHENIPVAALQEAVQQYQVPPGRGKLLEGRHGISIIDDTYNSSPEAVKAALIMLKEFSTGRRTVAVLGRMNELGSESKSLHQDVATFAAKTVDLLVLVGEYGKVMRETAIDAKLPAEQIIIYETPEACIAGIEAILKPEDVILVKASQNGMQLERVVKILLADPKQHHQLVRQAAHWQHV